MTEIVNAAEFAKQVGVSKQRIVKAIEEGVLVSSVKVIKKNKNKSYEIRLADGLREWSANIDPAKQRDNIKQAATRELGDGKDPATSSNFQKARSVKEFYGAGLARLEFEEKAGKLVNAERIKAEAFKISRRVRDSVMGVPERVSAEVAAMSDPREISIYLTQQLADALRDLKGLENVQQSRP